MINAVKRDNEIQHFYSIQKSLFYRDWNFFAFRKFFFVGARDFWSNHNLSEQRR